MKSAKAEKPLGMHAHFQSRFTEPAFYGKPYPRQTYKSFVLMGNMAYRHGAAGNEAFYTAIKEALDLIERKAPFLFTILRAVNGNGRRVIFYAAGIGPASFNAWGDAYVVRITTTHLDGRPVFDNNPYYLAATLVHELIGHGKQAEDGRLWAMYEWCGHDVENLSGVTAMPNRQGNNSGFVEYEANLYAQWFLESAQNAYPDYIEHVIKRYLRIVMFLNQRFPSWYDDEKPSWILLREFETKFLKLCPGLKFTKHPLPR